MKQPAKIQKTLKELDTIKLSGVIVHVYPEARGYEVEIFAPKGKSLAVITILADELEQYEKD